VKYFAWPAVSNAPGPVSGCDRTAPNTTEKQKRNKNKSRIANENTAKNKHSKIEFFMSWTFLRTIESLKEYLRDQK